MLGISPRGLTVKKSKISRPAAGVALFVSSTTGKRKRACYYHGFSVFANQRKKRLKTTTERECFMKMTSETFQKCANELP